MNKKGRQVTDNLNFIISHIIKWEKSIFLSIGLYSIFLGVSPFIWIYVPKLLLEELTGERRVEKLLLILVSALLIASVVGFLKDYLRGNYRMKMNTVRYGFIRMLSKKTMKMNYTYTENPETLNEIKIALKTVQSPMEGIGLVILKLFSIPGNMIGFIVFSVILISLDPMIWGMLVISMICSYLYAAKANKYQRSRKDELAGEERLSYYNSLRLADFQYGKDIRVYGLKELILDKKRKADSNVILITEAIQKRFFVAGVKEGILMAMREGVVYGYLIIKILDRSLTISDFVLYTFAMNGFVTWMDTTIKDFSDVWLHSLYVSDFREFLKKSEEPYCKKEINIPKKSEQYDIVFDKVSFHYPGSSREIFKDFTVHIKPGEKLALVGINGAGKTTLVKLLTRLYEPTGGRILVNGIDIREYDLEEYRSLFSVVFQDTKVFAFTIRENITMESDTKDEEKYQKVLIQSGIHEKIDSLEKKDETNLLKILDEKGIELSGGENQKLAMARALYKNGEIIIMDEPTAALDALAESKMYMEFDNLIKNKSAIYISHRLSSTRFCDNIAFIQNGELMEYGTHEELMELNRDYAKMFRMQAEYYKEDKHEE